MWSQEWKVEHRNDQFLVGIVSRPHLWCEIAYWSHFHTCLTCSGLSLDVWSLVTSCVSKAPLLPWRRSWTQDSAHSGPLVLFAKVWLYSSGWPQIHLSFHHRPLPPSTGVTGMCQQARLCILFSDEFVLSSLRDRISLFRLILNWWSSCLSLPSGITGMDTIPSSLLLCGNECSLAPFFPRAP